MTWMLRERVQTGHRSDRQLDKDSDRARLGRSPARPDDHPGHRTRPAARSDRWTGPRNRRAFPGGQQQPKYAQILRQLADHWIQHLTTFPDGQSRAASRRHPPRPPNQARPPAAPRRRALAAAADGQHRRLPGQRERRHEHRTRGRSSPTLGTCHLPTPKPGPPLPERGNPMPPSTTILTAVSSRRPDAATRPAPRPRCQMVKVASIVSRRAWLVRPLEDLFKPPMIHQILPYTRILPGNLTGSY
jgi:hypothetical protein